MAKKIYIAARFKKKDIVGNIADKLCEQGHKITSTWTNDPSIQPYEKNAFLARKYALRDVKAIKDSDVFILISDKSGTGMYTELGEAIFSYVYFHKPEIYIVGKYNSGSIQFFLPFVKMVKSIKEVVNQIK